MSVSVPIYQRILYGSPTIPPEKEEKQETSLKEQDQNLNISQEIENPLAEQQEVHESTRHSLSVLSIHVRFRVILL